jgi:hypothetical protein
MSIDPPQKEMSRFLAKMALEAIFQRFSLGSLEEALKLTGLEHYDNIRKWARLGDNLDKWPYHYRQYFPEETLMRHPKTNNWVQFGYAYDLLLTDFPETYFIWSYYGHEFAINIGGPAIKGYELWLQGNNNVSFLIEKRGRKIIKELNNKKVTYYIEEIVKPDIT